MTAQVRSVLKTYFETGDFPTQSQFSDTIDSFLSLLDTTGQSIASDVSAQKNLDVKGTCTVSALNVTGSINFSGAFSAATINANVGNITTLNTSTVSATLGNITTVNASTVSANIMRTITASALDSSTNVATTQFASPGVSVSASGYVKFPAGIVLQWGKTGTVTSSSTVVVNFPLSFPNNVWSVNVTVGSPVANSSPNIQSISNSSVTIGNPGPSNTMFYWMAIGN